MPHWVHWTSVWLWTCHLMTIWQILIFLPKSTKYLQLWLGQLPMIWFNLLLHLTDQDLFFWAYVHLCTIQKSSHDCQFVVLIWQCISSVLHFAMLIRSHWVPWHRVRLWTCGMLKHCHVSFCTTFSTLYYILHVLYISSVYRFPFNIYLCLTKAIAMLIILLWVWKLLVSVIFLVWYFFPILILHIYSPVIHTVIN